MKKACLRTLLTLLLIVATAPSQAAAPHHPWSHGRLVVSPGARFLQHADGTPFFWLADTGWLLPERLNRDEAAFYLQQCGEAGFNVVMVQVMNDVPAYNAYGQPSLAEGWDFSHADRPGVYGYWNHMDYIVDQAARQGIYVGMVCIWGGLVKSGRIDADGARSYGRFLAQRYKDRPNIVWVMGGDIQGDVHPEVWDALATAIKAEDANHLMTFHPRGRTTSARWFANRQWLDFNLFQSGHRRYDQRMGNKHYPIPDGTEEDSWMYVDSTWSYKPLKPVIDGEPSYEDIPKGLHDFSEERWQPRDVRRYAYWAVFAGACGHTYGHNSVMQMRKPGYPPAYGTDEGVKMWYDALRAPGRWQMRYLKWLMLAFPYQERVADQAIVCGRNGTRYNRLLATRGNDYLMVYNYNCVPMTVDLTRISGERKDVWWMDAATGQLFYIGAFDNRPTTFNRQRPDRLRQHDGVLIAVDDSRHYLSKEQTMMEDPEQQTFKKDLTE